MPIVYRCEFYNEDLSQTCPHAATHIVSDPDSSALDNGETFCTSHTLKIVTDLVRECPTEPILVQALPQPPTFRHDPRFRIPNAFRSTNI